jgi:hypothetical protein
MEACTITKGVHAISTKAMLIASAWCVLPKPGFKPADAAKIWLAIVLDAPNLLLVLI